MSLISSSFRERNLGVSSGLIVSEFSKRDSSEQMSVVLVLQSTDGLSDEFKSVEDSVKINSVFIPLLDDVDGLGPCSLGVEGRIHMK